MKHLDRLIFSLKNCCASLPDRRSGANTQYLMSDIGLSAFSIFFMQSPSFLSHQRSFEKTRGKSNCQTLFGIEKIPSDNHIRSMLDEVAPEHLFGQFNHIVGHLNEHGGLDGFKRLNGRILIALDGVYRNKGTRSPTELGKHLSPNIRLCEMAVQNETSVQKAVLLIFGRRLWLCP